MRIRSSSWWSRVAWLPACALIAIAVPAGALTAPSGLDDLEEADRKALETIAGYPEPQRDAALRASLHVDELVETQRIQEQSSAAFSERINGLDKKQQEQIWNVVREPGLLAELASDEPPSAARLDEIAKRHPEDLSPAIHELGARHTICSSTSRASTTTRASASTRRSPTSTKSHSRRSASSSTSPS
jgi:hypothetical protein